MSSCSSWAPCGSCIPWYGDRPMTQLLDSIHYDQWILHALILLPLAGVVPILLGDERTAKRTALVVTLLELVLSLGLWWAFDPSNGGMLPVFSAPLISRWGIIYRGGMDRISLFLGLLNTGMMLLNV